MERRAARCLDAVTPNSSAPVPLKTATAGGDGPTATRPSLSSQADFPKLDTSTDGYAGMYQLRLADVSDRRRATTTYDSADIQVTTAAAPGQSCTRRR